MDRTGSESPSPEDLCLRNPQTLDDLGYSLHRLRKRFAWRRHDMVVSYRFLAARTGYAHSAIAEYFAGTALPPPDKLDAIVVFLGANEDERLAFAKAHDAIEERRRRGLVVGPGAPGADGERIGLVRPEAAASSYLYDLLFGRAVYRELWRRHLTARNGPVAAIATVIADHLATSGEVAQEAERLQGRIARALASGGADTVMSSVTLEWFIEAFVMQPDDAERLRVLRAGSSAIRYVRGVVEETRLPVFDLPPQRHRTVDLREYHFLGSDGLPVRHRTDQIIEALEDGFDRYMYMVDTGMLTVDVECGGVPGPPYQVCAKDGAVYHAVDIVLDTPLASGQTAVLNYTTTLDYTEVPPCEMRRAFRSRVDKFMLRVQFHAARRPERLWWAEWDAVTNGEITHREPVSLSASGDAHRFLEGGVEGAIIGFCWEW